ncbi:MAG: phage portal protein, partial [Dehalococcoidia bacterium]
FNYARAVVDKTTSYLMTGLDFAVDPPEPTAEGEALARRTEAVLRRVNEENALDQLDFETELDAAILGDAAFKVTWDAERERVRVTAPDVQGLFAWWRGDDPSRVWRVASRYQVSAAEAHMLFGVAAPLMAGARERGLTVVEEWTAERFALWVEDRLHEQMPNPYGLIPFVIYPNLREAKAFWGISDITAIMEPARELNRALSQLSLILEMSGNPIAVLENVTDSGGIAVAPGAVWELPQDAKAYLLDLLQGGGVRLHADYIDLIYRTLHDLGESPRTAFGENRQGLSGVALNTELDPLLKKVQRKRLIRSAAYRRRNELILRVLERFTGETFAPYRTRVVWGPVLPQDRSRQVADERVLVEAGIHSRRRAADALGVEDPESEFRRWLEEEGRMQGAQGAPPAASNGAVELKG